MATTMAKRASMPTWFFWAGIALVLWGLMGIAALIAHVSVDEAALAKMPPADAAAFRALPGWFAIDFAIGTIASVLGAVALVRGARWAAPISLIALAALLVQFGYVFVATDTLARQGATAAILPAVIIAAASGQLWLARTGAARGWLR